MDAAKFQIQKDATTREWIKIPSYHIIFWLPNENEIVVIRGLIVEIPAEMIQKELER